MLTHAFYNERVYITRRIIYDIMHEPLLFAASRVTFVRFRPLKNPLELRIRSRLHSHRFINVYYSLSLIANESVGVTDEEIDVESVPQTDPVRQAESFAREKHNQLRPKANLGKTAANTATAQNTVARRPRGRPPGSTNAAKRKKNPAQNAPVTTGLKRPAPQDSMPTSTPKRARVSQQTTQRGPRGKVRRNQLLSEDEEDKRNMHNNMERQRRISLRNLFEELRQKVPETAKKDKAPKVAILTETQIYCNDLVHKNDRNKSANGSLDYNKQLLEHRFTGLRRAIKNGQRRTIFPSAHHNRRIAAGR